MPLAQRPGTFFVSTAHMGPMNRNHPTGHHGTFEKVRKFVIAGGLSACLVMLAFGGFPITEVM
ncbi:hypothetical protein Achl_4250 (plasmid) [Pseudarthrobacter chlorophenolicus A6]|uniref:Uncharacterized protein n=1 Tax=Pseudarthrobacter chlorophenolicus (strain ATCC 700700 / DSM 12829 / CIP 107037 / JCM 12360 / KCTC 9906 / NCIMB 13794 / A6) TaxID=452863 RepID=B8HIF4_PSECP|nr:hypothetical protein Achl_4250 [Pseudarthrobacter chlorophenolicus A6]SDQ14803.1 hypothetical protein SAMN04489738_0308 [Pseudarthrobacter chlorophenolicus]